MLGKSRGTIVRLLGLTFKSQIQGQVIENQEKTFGDRSGALKLLAELKDFSNSKICFSMLPQVSRHHRRLLRLTFKVKFKVK